MGFLWSFSYVGSILGSIMVNVISVRFGILRCFAIAIILFGIGMVLFSNSSTLFLAFIAVVIEGFALGMYSVCLRTGIQQEVDQDILGRTFANISTVRLLFSMLFMTVAGLLGDIIGAERVILYGGFIVLCTGFSALMFYRNRRRRVSNEN